MKFEERKAAAQRLVVGYLDGFSPPRGLDDRQMAQRIDSIADAFARKMPTNRDFREAVAGVLTRVSDTHLSNTWPPQAAFVMAMPAGEAMGRPAAESFRVSDPVQHYGDLMRAGEGVPEPVLWGNISALLPSADLERYRSASVMTWAETYGQDAASAMMKRYGSIVAGYFAGSQEARDG